MSGPPPQISSVPGPAGGADTGGTGAGTLVPAGPMDVDRPKRPRDERDPNPEPPAAAMSPQQPPAQGPAAGAAAGGAPSGPAPSVHQNNLHQNFTQTVDITNVDGGGIGATTGDMDEDMIKDIHQTALANAKSISELDKILRGTILSWQQNNESLTDQFRSIGALVTSQGDAIGDLARAAQHGAPARAAAPGPPGAAAAPPAAQADVTVAITTMATALEKLANLTVAQDKTLGAKTAFTPENIRRLLTWLGNVQGLVPLTQGHLRDTILTACQSIENILGILRFNPEAGTIDPTDQGIMSVTGQWDNAYMLQWQSHLRSLQTARLHIASVQERDAAIRAVRPFFKAEKETSGWFNNTHNPTKNFGNASQTGDGLTSKQRRHQHWLAKQAGGQGPPHNPQGDQGDRGQGGRGYGRGGRGNPNGRGRGGRGGDQNTHAHPNQPGDANG